MYCVEHLHNLDRSRKLLALNLFVDPDGLDVRLSRDGVDQLHDLPVVFEVPSLNSRHFARLHRSLI